MQAHLLANLLDEINGYGPRVQPNGKPYSTTADAVCAPTQRQMQSSDVSSIGPSSALTEKPVTKSPAEWVQFFEEDLAAKLAKIPKRKVADAGRSCTDEEEEDAELIKPSHHVINLSNVVDHGANYNIRVRKDPMWSESGKTLDQHLAEFEEKNAEGEAFEDIVSAAFDATNAGKGSKKHSHDEFEITAATDISALAAANTMPVPAQKHTGTLMTPRTKKVKTNTGFAAIPRVTPVKTNRETEYSDKETEHRPVKNVIKLGRAKNPAPPKANKKLAKIFAGTVKGAKIEEQEEHVSVFQKAVKLTPAQIAARKTGGKK